MVRSSILRSLVSIGSIPAQKHGKKRTGKSRPEFKGENMKNMFTPYDDCRDRLRAVECPSDIIDQIGGWTTTGIGHAYGNGYSVEILAKWMERIKTSFLFD